MKIFKLFITFIFNKLSLGFLAIVSVFIIGGYMNNSCIEIAIGIILTTIFLIANYVTAVIQIVEEEKEEENYQNHIQKLTKKLTKK